MYSKTERLAAILGILGALIVFGVVLYISFSVHILFGIFIVGMVCLLFSFVLSNADPL